MKMSSLEILVVCQQGLCSLSLSVCLQRALPKFQTRIWTGIRPGKKTQKNSAGLVQCALAQMQGLAPRGCEQKLLTGYPNTNIGRLQQTKPNWFNNNNNKPKKNMKRYHCPTWYDTPAKLQWQLHNSLPHLIIWRHSKTDYYLLLPIHQQHRYTDLT